MNLRNAKWCFYWNLISNNLWKLPLKVHIILNYLILHRNNYINTIKLKLFSIESINEGIYSLFKTVLVTSNKLVKTTKLKI